MIQRRSCGPPAFRKELSHALSQVPPSAVSCLQMPGFITSGLLAHNPKVAGSSPARPIGRPLWGAGGGWLIVSPLEIRLGKFRDGPSGCPPSDSRVPASALLGCPQAGAFWRPRMRTCVRCPRRAHLTALRRSCGSPPRAGDAPAEPSGAAPWTSPLLWVRPSRPRLARGDALPESPQGREPGILAEVDVTPVGRSRNVLATEWPVVESAPLTIARQQREVIEPAAEPSWELAQAAV